MSETITLDRDEALRLWGSEETDNYELIDQVYIGQWRWGNDYQIVIKDKATERLYAAGVKEQTGDHYYISWEDLGQVVFTEVIRVERIDYSYRPA